MIVSVPCTGQSGRGGGIVMYSTDKIVSDNDKTQIDRNNGCLNGAASVGDPAVGPFKKSGYQNYYYVHGTPIMATMYGLDVVAQQVWGKAPDLLLSGPNEGQNVGSIINSSGTIGNVQFAAGRGIPSIALSAGQNTADNQSLANPESKIVATQAVKLVRELQAKAGNGALLPKGLALNVNFPNGVKTTTPFAFSKVGSFNLYNLKFSNNVPYGFTGTSGSASGKPTASQQQDESYVSQTKISVTAMQVLFDHRPTGQEWLKLRLRNLFN